VPLALVTLQTASPDFAANAEWQAGTTLAYSPDTSAAGPDSKSGVTLTVVRPLAHPTHPIRASGPTVVIFATGPSSIDVPIGMPAPADTKDATSPWQVCPNPLVFSHRIIDGQWAPESDPHHDTHRDYLEHTICIVVPRTLSCMGPQVVDIDFAAGYVADSESAQPASEGDSDPTVQFATGSGECFFLLPRDFYPHWHALQVRGRW
jgi:hypothetical protein